MSIYSRSYMRPDYASGRGREFNAVLWLIAGLALMFVLQRVTGSSLRGGPLEGVLGLDLPNLRRFFVHTLVTYGYLHSTEPGLPWHLIMNGFFLFMFGRFVQADLGARRFLELFHFAVLTGGIAAALALPIHPYSVVIGASGGISGILALFALHRWQLTMEFLLFFVFPVKVSGRIMFYVLFGSQALLFLLVELPGSDNVSYSCHLGGILGAVLYDRYLLARGTLWETVSGFFAQPAKQSPAWVKRGTAAQRKSGRFTLNLGQSKAPKTAAPQARPTPAHLRGEVDRILDKINARGFGSLTAEEKRVLEEAKDRLR